MATNRIDILDSALLRPGRIDRKIEFPNPSESSRVDILRIHSRKMNLTRGIDLKRIADKMGGASGAELKACCTEAGMFALRERRVHVTQEDFEMAVAKVRCGCWCGPRNSPLLYMVLKLSCKMIWGGSAVATICLSARALHCACTGCAGCSCGCCQQGQLPLLTFMLVCAVCTTAAGDEEGQRQEHECEEALEVEAASVWWCCL
jgi:hypothetical protein